MDTAAKLLDLQIKYAGQEQEILRLKEVVRAQRRLLLQWQERHDSASNLQEETKFINR